MDFANTIFLIRCFQFFCSKFYFWDQTISILAILGLDDFNILNQMISRICNQTISCFTKKIRKKKNFKKGLTHIQGGVRWGRVNIVPPQTNFKTLVNKNAIKPEIGGPPQAIFQESPDPPRDFGKKHQVPPPLDFQPVCIPFFIPKSMLRT